MIGILLLTFSPLLRGHFSQDTRHLSYATSYPAPSSCVTLVPLTPSSYQLHTPPRTLKSPFRTRTFGVNNELTCPTGNFEQHDQSNSGATFPRVLTTCRSHPTQHFNLVHLHCLPDFSGLNIKFMLLLSYPYRGCIWEMRRQIFILPLGVRN